jgi:D-arginine dehydrogenase
MRALPEAVDAVIVGAGIGGAATAWWLARAGVRVLVLEREDVPASHSSGRNAAIGRIVCADETDRALAREALAFYRSPPAGFGRACIHRSCGSLTLANGEALGGLRELASALEREGTEAAWLEPADAIARLPLLAGAPFTQALWCPEEPVLDTHGIVEGLLAGARAAGAIVDTGVGLDGVEVARGRVHTVASGERRVRTEWFVNAAGGWAGEVGALCGAAPMPLRVTRRHLMVTAASDDVDPAWPIAWDVASHWYVRPESGGLLLSGCDITDTPPCDAKPDADVVTELLGKLTSRLPALGGARLAKSWAGLRTLTPDGRFIIGPDTELSGFLWVAGLGGHGMSAGASLGRLAAGWITGASLDDPLAHALSPGRFALHSS